MKRPKRGVPEGLWLRCDGCSATVFRNQVNENLNVCPECDHHFYVPTAARLRQLLDPDSFEEWYQELSPVDPLGFADRVSYSDRIQKEQARTGMNDEAADPGAPFTARWGAPAPEWMMNRKI